MKKRLILLFLLAAFLMEGQAQYPIQVKVDSVPHRKAFLLDFVGLKNNLVDSAAIAPDGTFSFTLPKTAHPGLYRIVVGPNTFWDVIFNREKIRVHTHYGAVIDSLKVLESKENQLLARYMQFYVGLNRKAELLQRLASLYRPGEPFYQQVIQEMRNLQAADPDQLAREIITNNPDTYVANFLRLELAPAVPKGLSQREEIVYVIEHFWDGINFTDTALMYSPALANKIRTFFTLYPRAYPPAEAEEAMKRGLDRLMSLSAANGILFEFILEEVVGWVERTEFDDFFGYLTEFYLAEAACQDEKRAGEFGERVEAYQKTAIGNRVAEIVIPNEKTGALLLSEMPSAYTLVVFWASWCSHCNQMLPELKALYERYNRKDFEVLAISLDQKRSEWEAALKAGGYNWINHSELKGWDCSIAYDYGIRATPTFLLVDRNRTVVARPRNVTVLEMKLNELGIKPLR
ncbi:MAG: thioredoxin-like domain-containing protein [Bacteroidales bacterium]